MIESIALTFNPADLPQQLVNGLMTGAIYALVALGYTMVYGVLRLINFAHGEVFMLGTFFGLFASWQMGYTPGHTLADATHPGVLIVMMLSAMIGCGLVGVLIERFAYRPVRKQSRLNSLITAIGVSLLLQHGGALILPTSPPPSVSEKVNPFRDEVRLWLKPQDQELFKEFKVAETSAKVAKQSLADEVARLKVGSEFDLPKDSQVRGDIEKANTTLNKINGKLEKSGVSISVSTGKVIMLSTTLILMLILTWLVMKTPMGRQMRAVSHDMESASLMGINVNKVVTRTFLIGSVLAGAGGMMASTFLGLSLSPFSGLEFGVKAFVAAVLGGIGNIPGAVLGGMLMGTAESMATAFGMSQFKDVIAFLILILVLILKPSGILGKSSTEKV